MGRLRGRVDHELERVRVVGEDAAHGVEVADVHGERPERPAVGGQEPVRLGRRGCGRAEVVRPHVVLQADHVEACLHEMRD